MRKIIYIFISLLFLYNGWAADQENFPNIYIAAGGTGDGSQASPLGGLDGLNTTTGGENSIFDYYAGSPTASVTINLKRGDTFQEDSFISIIGPTIATTAQYPIIIQGYGAGDRPKIDGAKIINDGETWSDQGSNVWRTSASQDPYVMWFDGSPGTNVGSETPDASGEWVYKGGTGIDVYSKGDPTSFYELVEAYDKPGVRIYDQNHIVIDGIHTYRTRGAGIKVFGATTNVTDITVKNCLNEYMSGGDLGVIYPGANQGYVLTNALITNNEASYGETGIYIIRANDSVFSNNYCHHNGRANSKSPFGEEYGIALSGGHRNLFFGNKLTYNNGNGLFIWGGGRTIGKTSGQNKVYNNEIFYNNIDSVYNQNEDYRADLMVGTGSDVQEEGDCEDTEVYNNKVISNLIGIKDYGEDTIIYGNIVISTAGSTDEGILVAGNDNSSYTKIYNNTIYNFANCILISGEFGGYTGLDAKNNIFSNCTTSISRPFVGTWDHNLVNGTTDYSFSAETPLISDGPTYAFFNLSDGNMAEFTDSAAQITLTDRSSETLVGYIGEADALKGYGNELITAQNNKDFSSGTIGNWGVFADGSCTVTYDSTDIGGDDDKQGKITSSNDSYCFAKLTTLHFTVKHRRSYEASTELYTPSANTNQKMRMRITGFGDDVNCYQTLSDDTWTTVTCGFTVGSDTTGQIMVAFSGNPEDGDIIYFDNNSIKCIQTSGTDGVVIYKTSDLTTEGWIDSDSNYDWGDTSPSISISPGGAANDVVGDPLFVDATNNNLRLKLGSPAIDTGTWLSIHVKGTWRDIYNRAYIYGDGVDIGASETFRWRYVPGLGGIRLQVPWRSKWNKP